MFGRLEKRDIRDRNHPILLSPEQLETKIQKQYWYQDDWWGNQKNTPKCVGFSWRHWLMDGPIPQKRNAIWAVRIYKQAKRVDSFPGTNYDGTTVRAGAKILKKRGYIKSYKWAFNVNTIIKTVLTKSPIVVGTTWYSDMTSPTPEGIIIPSGRKQGGHAYLINGVDLTTGMFRIKNSWGQDWGIMGNAFIPISDFEKLLENNGEACLAVEIEHRK